MKEKEIVYFGPFMLFAGAIISLISLYALIAIGKGFFLPIDYWSWRMDWQILTGCVNENVFATCRELSKFPVAYLLNSFWGGQNHRIISYANIFSLVLPIVLLWVLQGWRMAVAVGSVYFTALVLSPLSTFYIYSGALEIQAGVVTGVFMASLVMVAFEGNAHSRRSFTYAILAFSGFFLPLYKDTALLALGASFLLIVAYRVASVVGQQKSNTIITVRSWNAVRAVLLAGGLPVAVGVLVGGLYNLKKYGVFWPVAYFDEANLTMPTFYRSLEFFSGALFSLNGGVVVFWFVPFFLLLIGLRILRLSPSRTIICFGVIAALISCVGFSRWWAPFGWDAWGNRLMIQPMLALFVAIILSVGREAYHPFSIKRFLGVLVLSVPLLFWSGYYIVNPYVAGRSEALSRSLWPGFYCIEMRTALAEEAVAKGLGFWKTETYYRCARERMLHIPPP